MVQESNQVRVTLPCIDLVTFRNLRLPRYSVFFQLPAILNYCEALGLGNVY